jgi:hypothetical protein
MRPRGEGTLLPRILAACLVAAAAACGSEGPTDAEQVATFRATADRIDTSATAYGSGAGTMADQAGCLSMHAGYDADVRPMVERMRDMSGSMDEHMASMGGAGHADMACGAAAMMAELDRHAAAACASATMPANAAEAAAHAGTMHDWAAHQRARADEMGGMMNGGGGMMGGGGTMGGGDPTFTCPTP